jgi:CheY-like chemotaxis protein
VREADEDQLSGSALVVVPNMALARALGRVAERVGLVPLIALAADAIDVALREKPRIVLLDLDDPEPALTLCRELRAQPATAQLPILGVTSSAQLPRARAQPESRTL